MTSRLVTYSIRAANQGDTQYSDTTESGKSKIVVPEQRTAKTESNPKNSRRFTGPTTQRGKRNSSRNARKHGLYSRELLISEADMPEFEEMRFGLEAQLQPSTVFQRLAFDYVVVCQWRVKLALRLERAQFARQFEHEKPKGEPGEAVDIDPVIERWYGSSRADTREGIRCLESAMEEFQRTGYFGDDTKAFLRSAFGSDYVPFLEEWKTMSPTVIAAAEHLERHCELFGDVPDAGVNSASTPSEPIKVVIDPLQGQHMVVKLLQERRNFLNELLFVTGQNTLAGTLHAEQSSEFNPRFLADANRELRRAVEWYMFLVDRDL